MVMDIGESWPTFRLKTASWTDVRPGAAGALGRIVGRPVAASRLALVHDYLLVMRGAERTFAAMAGAWPEAPIVTLLYDEAGSEGRFAGRSVSTSFLQRLGARQHNFRALLPAFGKREYH